jgi:hypothetical protein
LPGLTLLFPLFVFPQIYGCTDPLATNYNPNATLNDGSCLYAPASVNASYSVDLSSDLSETSGLCSWNQYIWTHNDNSDNHLYGLDSVSGTILTEYTLPGLENIDWEEISQDEDFLYIGDFGNNQNGNRTDLSIYRIDKQSLIIGSPEIETIHFAYSNQYNFQPTGLNNTNFDCEAMVVSRDSIYLFTKQWLNNQTSMYVLPKSPGTYTARFRESLNVGFLVTAATYFEEKRLIVLSGYSSLLQPSLFLLYDFRGDNFFTGNKRSVGLNLPFHQVEGIAGTDGLSYYLSNERFSQPPVITVPQALHKVVLDEYLEYYLQHLNASLEESPESAGISVYPSLTHNQVSIVAPQHQFGSLYKVISTNGKTLLKGVIRNEVTYVSLKSLSAGDYYILISGVCVHIIKY